MNLLLHFYPGDAGAWFAAHVFVQVTVVVLLAEILARLGSRWNAAWRHSIYRIALLCVLIIPVQSWMMQSTGFELVTLRTSVSEATTIEPVRITAKQEEAMQSPAPGRIDWDGVDRVIVEAQVTPRGTAIDIPKEKESIRPNLPSVIVPTRSLVPARSFSDILRAIGGGVFALWIAGMILLLARWFYGLHLISAFRRSVQPLDSGALPDLLQQVCHALGAKKLPALATSARLDRPIMVGLFRPLVILPDHVLRTLCEPELADVLIHECAHAVCKHQLVGLLQRLAVMIFWPQPLIHLLNRQLARAREEVCDNYVLRHRSAPRYARTLLELSQLLTGVSPKPAALGLFHCRLRLEDRVADLLDRRRKTMIRVSRLTAAVLTAVFLLFVLTLAGTRILQADPTAEKAAADTVKTIEKTTKKTTEKTTQTPTEKASEKTTEKITEKITEKTVEKSADGASFEKGTEFEKRTAVHDLCYLETEMVQMELELTEAQKEKLAPLLKELREWIGKAESDKTNEARMEIVKKFEVILNPRQIERLLEISMQTMDMSSLALKTDAGKILALTDDQKEKIKSIDQDAMKALSKVDMKVYSSGTFSKEDARKQQESIFEKVLPILKEAKEKSEKVLTPEQRETLRKLTGKEVDLKKLHDEILDASLATIPFPKDKSEFAPAGGTKGEASPTPEAEKKEKKQAMRETWQLGVDLNMPSLDPQAVQFAVFDKDPVPGFIAQVKRTQIYHRQQLDTAKDEANKDVILGIQMAGAWNYGFKDVTGDNLYLLTKGTGYSKTGMMSNEPAGKKWLVTKAVQIKGKPVCWCIPIEVKVGEARDITFDEKNTFDLKSVYDKAMKEPAEGENKPKQVGEVNRITQRGNETIMGVRPSGTCSISGKVVSDATGEPIKNGKMYLHYNVTHGSIFIYTDSNGDFLFQDIPTGPYSLQLSLSKGYQDMSYNPENKPGQFPPFSLKEGEHRTGIVLKAKQAYRISGKVLDEEGKVPKDIATLEVLAWSKSDEGENHRMVQTGVKPTDGSYTIDGLDGKPVYVMAINWRAAKLGNAYPPIYYPGTFSRNDAKQITFDKSPSIDDANLTLRKDGGLMIEGTVRNEEGKPIPEAFVVVHRPDMLFDFATAYTDNEGHYQIQGLGEGEFLLHVDAVHRGFARMRTPVTLDKTNEKTHRDIILKRGVLITGKLVDEKGNDWQIGTSFGSAHLFNRPPTRLHLPDIGSIFNWTHLFNDKDETPSVDKQDSGGFSLTDFRNKYRPQDMARASGGDFELGEGNYLTGQMLFPTPSTFVIQGMTPGHILFHFLTNKEGQKVTNILYNGKDIMQSGIDTKAGEQIKDVTIVIGPE